MACSPGGANGYSFVFSNLLFTVDRVGWLLTHSPESRPRCSRFGSELIQSAHRRGFWPHIIIGLTALDLKVLNSVGTVWLGGVALKKNWHGPVSVITLPTRYCGCNWCEGSAYALLFSLVSQFCVVLKSVAARICFIALQLVLYPGVSAILCPGFSSVSNCLFPLEQAPTR